MNKITMLFDVNVPPEDSGSYCWKLEPFTLVEQKAQASNKKSEVMCENCDKTRRRDLMSLHDVSSFHFHGRPTSFVFVETLWTNEWTEPSNSKNHKIFPHDGAFYPFRSPSLVKTELMMKESCSQLQPNLNFLIWFHSLSRSLDRRNLWWTVEMKCLKSHKECGEGFCTVCRHRVKIWEIEKFVFKRNLLFILWFTIFTDEIDWGFLLDTHNT